LSIQILSLLKNPKGLFTLKVLKNFGSYPLGKSFFEDQSLIPWNPPFLPDMRQLMGCCLDQFGPWHPFNKQDSYLFSLSDIGTQFTHSSQQLDTYMRGQVIHKLKSNVGGKLESEMNADPTVDLVDQPVSLPGILNQLFPAFRADSPGLPISIFHRPSTEKAVWKRFVTFFAIKLGKTWDFIINPCDRYATGLAVRDLFLF